MKPWGDNEMAGWLDRVLGRASATSQKASAERRAEIGAALLVECDRLDALIAETRHRWRLEAGR